MEVRKRILMVLTSRDRIDDAHPTGLWLEEFAVPYLAFAGAGFQVTVVSLAGGKVPVDPRSLAQGIPEEWQRTLPVLENSGKLLSNSMEGMDALILPGGHGPMFDLAVDELLADLLRQAAESGKVIGAVCHGPAGLVKATLTDGRPLVSGKKVTGFSNQEESAVQMDHLVPFLLEDRLKELGADYSSNAPWTEHVVRDGKLITGQNPQSSEAFSRTVIAALQD